MVLKSRRLAPDWSADGDRFAEAKCRKFDVTRGRDPWFDDEEEAAEICLGTNDGFECPMRSRCLGRALVNNEQYGIFGGFNLMQRRWIRKTFPMHMWAYPNPMAFGLMEQVPPATFFTDEPGEEDEEEYAHRQKAAS
jgi:hypothetical protein